MTSRARTQPVQHVLIDAERNRVLPGHDDFGIIPEVLRKVELRRRRPVDLNVIIGDGLRGLNSCIPAFDTYVVVIEGGAMALGELEQVVLLTLVRLGGEAHSNAVINEMDERLDRTVAPGALYTVMERLEQKGLVTSWIGDSIPERGGRRRKVYKLLPEGAKQLRSWYAGVRAMATQETLARLDLLAEGAS